MFLLIRSMIVFTTKAHNPSNILKKTYSLAKVTVITWATYYGMHWSLLILALTA